MPFVRVAAATVACFVLTFAAAAVRPAAAAAAAVSDSAALAAGPGGGPEGSSDSGCLGANCATDTDRDTDVIEVMGRTVSC